MSKYRITSAICTPLTQDETLHQVGLTLHIEDQWQAGITSLLVGGSMGQMQLLTDQTYHHLVEHAIEISNGRFELLIGAGDTGFARTRARIQWLNRLPIDGVVVLAPYMYPFSQSELIDYYRALADEARAPLYLYDLPQVTNTPLNLETVQTLSEHPNIAGIKCSADAGHGRKLHASLHGESFRVIVAQCDLFDMLLRCGIHDHLEGMFAVAPTWTMRLVHHATKDEWHEATGYQHALTQLKHTVLRYGMPAVTVLLNERGIPGHVVARPARQLSDSERTAFCAEPIVRRWLHEAPPLAPTPSGRPTAESGVSRS